MDRLWAPWRIGYIRRHKKVKKCIFCAGKKSAGLIVFKSKHSFVMLNNYPYNNGHLLVSPLRHLSDISRLSEEEAQDLFACIRKAKRLLDKTLKPQGYNIGANLGRIGGAGITGHLHFHVVPRWQGDSNFMPAACGTKIISQSLKELFKLLKNADSKRN